tara:strand:- start:606 stop:887 length:282 start_codon:yes stop_codon:yes gene_type:complete
MSDEEPERYHEWILWKFKQEKKMSEEQLQLNFFDSPHGGISSSDSIIRREMYEMQKHIHALQIRVKELADENYELRKKIIPDLSDKIPEVTGK